MTSKRLFDLLVTTSSAVLWVPAILVTALAILVFEGRPVLYWSRRVVGRGRVERIPKFRTMIRNAEAVYNRDVVPVAQGIRFLNTPPESRLYTPIGRVVERLAFTELPQLLFVLRGQMSLVGSRPLPENVMASLAAAYRDVEARIDTPAGMTGLVQLVGRENVSDEQRLALERSYCAYALGHNTWMLDLTILLFTVLAALRLKPHLTWDQANALLIAGDDGLYLVPQRQEVARLEMQPDTGDERPQPVANMLIDLPAVVARTAEANEIAPATARAGAIAAE